MTTDPLCPHVFFLIAVLFLAMPGLTGAADDLNPVTFHDAPQHEPVVLVRGGKARSEIVAPEDLGRTARGALTDVQSLIKRSTGADVEVTATPSGKTALVLKLDEKGNAGPISAEGFEIRTAPDRVLITAADQNGLAWGMYEFLERFVGVRFYWPDYANEFGHSGTSVVEKDGLIVDPVHLTDAPAFPKRERWPSGGPRIGDARMSHHDRRMRCGNTWPVQLSVHAPHGWDKIYKESRPEIFQLRKDGQRDFNMLCYGDPLTLKTYLEEIALQRKKQEKDEPVQRGRRILQGKSITVSPADAAVACRCEDCRALWDKEGGHYGTASKVLGTFVAKLGREVKERWPDMTVIFLPYKNYTMAPKGVDFTDNVQAQICGMPGLAQYKDSAIWDRMQSNVDSWVKLTGNRIQNWHYSCWPANRTEAAYLFPHTIQKYYRHNRDKTVGTFINGVSDHWPRQHLSLYVWLKVLWDPEVDVDAIIDNFCRRMYGPASGTMRELVGMLIEGWEGTEWSPHVLSPKTVYEQSYPREDVLKIKNLLETAYDEAAGNELVTRRLNYWAPSLRDFFAESKLVAGGEGIKPLKVYQTPEKPELDGKLTEKAWESVRPVHLVKAKKEKPKPQYPTRLKALWTREGIILGFHMEEPEIEKLKRDIGRDSRDASLIWWNDNVEIFLDPTGERRGYYQFIVNANGSLYDSIGRGNTGWDAEGVEVGAHVGEDYWSLEVFIPYDSMDGAVRPGTGVEWHGNFTRHRVTDRSNREYQAYNVTEGAPSHNQNAFGPVRFIER